MNNHGGMAMQGRIPIEKKCGKRGGMGRVFVVIGFLAGGMALWGAEQVSSLEKRVGELRREVLNDPSNLQKQELLRDLQGYQKRQDRQCLDALGKGLEAYQDVGPCAAKIWFQGASQSNLVRSLAQQALGVTLEDLMAECDTGEAAEAACTGCAGTGWQDCGMCSSTGTRLCQTCEGKGSVPKGDSMETEMCSRCGGVGARFCMSCGGYGIIKCRKCGGRGYMRSGKPRMIDPKRRAAFQRLIIQAGYLYQGGVDFSSAQSLRTTPRPSGMDVWDASGGAGGSSEEANRRLWQELMQRIAEGPAEGAKTEPAP